MTTEYKRMNVFRSVFFCVFCLPLISLYAQPKNFELNNPNAITLDENTQHLLTSGYWRVYKGVVENRGNMTFTRMNNSMSYYPDGRFFYNGSHGTWTILEGKFIDHQFDEQEAASRLNFGGIFSVTQINDSTLTLTKLLTTTHDFQRTLYLKSSTRLTEAEQPMTAGPYFYNGTLDKPALDSISHMSAEELFDAGFTILGSGTVHIISPDSLYVVKVNAGKSK